MLLAAVGVLLIGSDRAEGIALARKLAAKRASFNPSTQSGPRASFAEFDKTGQMPGDNFLSQIQTLLETDERAKAVVNELDAEEQAPDTANIESDEENEEDLALVQVGKVQSFCEICILVMQMKERGQPHLCAGLNDQYYVTCVEVLISILRADKALVYWLKNGCMHMDSTGPEIVRPCPAMNICSWIPNLFSQPPSVVRDGVEPMCPKDNKFLPTIPQEYKSLIPEDKTQKD